jgi:allantoate deiminase
MNPAQLGVRAEEMLTALGAISDEPGRLTRLFLGPAHARAIDRVRGWMQDAGLTVRVDALATVHGLQPAAKAGARAARRLLIGSHIDSVVDAGKYDGPLGVIAGILAIEEIRLRGIALPFAVEVLAFGDEEGVRFPKTLSSSLAIAGAFDPSALDATDKGGTTLRAALDKFGGAPDRIAAEAYRRDDVLGYLEVHIEQGPVLEKAAEPLAVVSAIAGQSRFRVHVTGEAGHAGTVPMALRRDALTAAAEMVLAVEAAAAAGGDGIVATVGEIAARPGAVNVIPGSVQFSLDLRAADDRQRSATAATIRQAFETIASRRGLSVRVEPGHDKPVTAAAPRLMQAIGAGITDTTGRTPRTMMSGAGHDGQALAQLTEIGMIFVRCRGGISHSPREYASPADMGIAIEALVRTIQRLSAAEAAR